MAACAAVANSHLRSVFFSHVRVRSRTRSNFKQGRAFSPSVALQQQVAEQPDIKSAHSMALSVNSKAAPCSLSSGEWLAAAERGAYTTARTVDGSSIFELTFHTNRLATSAHLMLEADVREGRPGAEQAWATHAAHLGDAAWLRPRVMASLRAGIAAFRQHNGSKAAASSSSSSSGNGSTAGASSNTTAVPELKLTVLVTWRPEGTVDVYSHVEPLPSRPAPPVRVEVRGAPRHNAAAKDSEWVRQRKALEQGKGPGVNEVLLSSPDGLVYEGLTSNFFAVVDGAVHTAEEGVLAGSVRHLILEVARREGVPVVLTPPRLADLDRWEGCFISSTSRLLLPVDELTVPAAGASGANGAHGAGQSRSFQRGGLVSRLEALVLQAVRAASEPLGEE